MKFKAKLISHAKGMFILQSDVTSSAIQDGLDYMVEIKPYKTNRSLEQNNLMWELITLIADYNNADAWETYIAGLKKTIPSGYIACLPDEEHKLASEFRAFEPCGTTYTDKGVKLTTYRVWVGSSKLNTKDMTTLIDYFSDWLEQLKEDNNDRTNIY